jgi:Predicted acyltransferases
MTLKGFFKRRLIRLQPMIVIGMIIGAIFFYLQDCGLWPGISEVPVWKMLLIALIGCTLLPVPLSLDIRGWQEGWPLDGPAWSLFFEYIGNILYALFIRKFSNRLLSALVFVSGLALLHLCITKGDVIGGWTPLEASHLSIGFTRLMFPFFAGLLLSRICKPKNLKHSFLICSLLIIICLSVPRIGGDQIWMNGLYVAFCIIVLFPVIVYLGASGSVTGKRASRLCEFLGDISYPVYITHYPLIYIYTAWATDNQVKWQEGLPYMVLVMVASIAMAYGCLKLYDMPVRKWLTNRFM